jgi:hypothetical protein
MARSKASTGLVLASMVPILRAATGILAPIGGTSGCVNEGCVRRAECGRNLCATCGLERELFRRDARHYL